jgi:hypothetical protein
MVELDGWSDYVLLYGLASVLGALGGLAFELMQTRRGATGTLEWWHASGKHFFDIGFVASLFIGAAAAAAALWLVPPEVTRVVTGGKTVTTREWDVVKVVSLSIIIGSAGGSFLTALQARALAMVKDQQAKATTQVANAQLERVASVMAEPSGHAQLLETVREAQAAIRAVGDSGPGNPPPDAF